MIIHVKVAVMIVLNAQMGLMEILAFLVLSLDFLPKIIAYNLAQILNLVIYFMFLKKN